MTPREMLRQAKIDHYLRHAEECYHMARYTAARRYLDLVFALDAHHSAGSALRRAVVQEFDAMVGRGAPGEARVPLQSADGRYRELVLVVDQHEAVLASSAAALRHHGSRFLGAATYEEAVEVLALVLPDIVVSEVNFEAGARGFDLFLWMRTNPALVNTPFLFHATRLDKDVLIAGKRFGVDDFLLKPVDGDVLAATIARALLRRRAAAS